MLQLPVPREDTHDTHRLRRELEELRASRMRLVLAADADRQTLERELHDGVQQRLVALAVELQLLEDSLASDPARARDLVQEIARDIDLALAEAGQLAERIYPSSLLTGGFAAALRSAAARSGTPVRVRVETDDTCPREVLAMIYWCLVEVLDHTGAEEATVTVHRGEEGIGFEIVGSRPREGVALDWVRDRVDALGGRLSIDSEPGADLRVAGSLPAAFP